MLLGFKWNKVMRLSVWGALDRQWGDRKWLLYSCVSNRDILQSCSSDLSIKGCRMYYKNCFNQCTITAGPCQNTDAVLHFVLSEPWWISTPDFKGCVCVCVCGWGVKDIFWFLWKLGLFFFGYMGHTHVHTFLKILCQLVPILYEPSRINNIDYMLKCWS